MSNGSIGVAISTTGDEHRLGFLETCVTAWRTVLPLGSVLVVTVDGDEEATLRAQEVVDRAGPRGALGGLTIQVGQGRPSRGGRQGVAVNKNTGIEYLMGAGVRHLFLCDDDTWPRHEAALTEHTEFRYDHSMVCWGAHRLSHVHRGIAGTHASWTWPRGVLLYVRRHVVEQVGGMVEEFGPGGHEHVEWSRRIHRAGFIPEPYLSPESYARVGDAGKATRAGALWHCEDLRRPDETSAANGVRRKQITTVRRTAEDWRQIEQIMKERDGDTSFVPYRARDNGRTSATLYTNQTRSEDA